MTPILNGHHPLLSQQLFHCQDMVEPARPTNNDFHFWAARARGMEQQIEGMKKIIDKLSADKKALLDVIAKAEGELRLASSGEDAQNDHLQG